MRESTNHFTEKGTQSRDLVELPARDQERPFEATIISSEESGETEFTLEIKNRMEEPVAARYAMEVVDDRGNSFSQVFTSENKSFGEKSDNRISFTPELSSLPDGYYILRAKIAFAGKNSILGNAETEIYIEVIDSVKKIVSEEEFQKNSLIGVAIQVKNTGGK